MLKKFIAITLLTSSLVSHTHPAAVMARIAQPFKKIIASESFRETFLIMTPEEAQKKLTEVLASNRKVFKVTGMLSGGLFGIGAGLYLYWLWQHYSTDKEFTARMHNARVQHQLFSRAEREEHIVHDRYGNPEQISLPKNQANVLRVLRESLNRAAKKMHDAAPAGTNPKDRFPREVNMRNMPTREVFSFLGFSREESLKAQNEYNRIPAIDQERRNNLDDLRRYYLPRYITFPLIAGGLTWLVWLIQAERIGCLKAMSLGHGWL